MAAMRGIEFPEEANPSILNVSDRLDSSRYWLDPYMNGTTARPSAYTFLYSSWSEYICIEFLYAANPYLKSILIHLVAIAFLGLCCKPLK